MKKPFFTADDFRYDCKEDNDPEDFAATANEKLKREGTAVFCSAGYGHWDTWVCEKDKGELDTNPPTHKALLVNIEPLGENNE